MVRMARNAPKPVEINVQVDGREYSGTYVIEGRGPNATLTASSPDGQRVTQLGGGLGLKADALARMLLVELARAGARRA